MRLYLTRSFFGFSLAVSLLAASACQRPRASAARDACIDPTRVNPSGICPMLYDPVCGCDGKTYSNACAAERAGVRSYRKGACPQ